MAVIKRIASKSTPSKIVNYLTKEEKTEEKLIGGKDCDPDNIVNDFNITQELYGKTDGIKYHHIIQSFSPEDDITPEKAHQLGKELAENQFKGHEVFVVTHKDKEHIHNHLVVNSVSFETGLKYNASNKSLWDIKRESNKICERENLKTIDLEHKADKRISSAEKRIMDRGETPWKDELRQIIDISKDRTNDIKSFREFLDKNFDIETRVTKNSISYKHPDHGKAIRGRSLGEKYNKEELENEFNGKEESISRNGERGSSRTEGDKQRGAINKTTRAEHESENGVREHSSEREFRSIEDTIRNVEQGIKGNSKREIETDNESVRTDRETSRGIEIEQSNITRNNESRVRENESDNTRKVEQPKQKVREADWGLDR